MSRITKLPDDLANQIAAGEVVERPAAVVKELVENAIDAEARRITITLELGGKKLMRVEDDGIGMDPADARLCLERHATSKIRRADDLGAIVTLGFRGEALPSIASVSHFRLRTRLRGADSGTEIRVNGGLIESEMEAGGPEGTLIEVGDLFYNLPARRKFLKSDAGESAQVSRVVTQLALCYPEVGFTLTSAGRKVIQVPPVARLHDRLYQLYGDRLDLVEVQREAGGVTLVGFVAALAEQGPTRGPQHVFINRRIVKDKTIAHAIMDAYSVSTVNGAQSGSAPVPDDTARSHRRERASHEGGSAVQGAIAVHEIVRRGVGDALGRGPAPELQLRPSDLIAGRPVAQSIPGVLGGGVYSNRWMPGASGATGATGASGAVPPVLSGATGAPGAAGAEGATGPRCHRCGVRRSVARAADDSARAVSGHLHSGHRR